MTRHDTVWQDADIAERFLGVRTAFPYALDHPRLLVDIIATGRDVSRFVDIGCGGGFFTHAVHTAWPDAHAVMIDFSEPMLREAESNITGSKQVLERDLASPDWWDAVGEVDAAVSGFAIHHLPDADKRRVYKDVFRLIRPGGWFINVEHVASASPVGTTLFDAHLTDGLFAYYRRDNPSVTREDVARQYDDRCDKDANILAPLESQCAWLRDIGFVDVDCFFKCYEIAIFGGRVPNDDQL